MASTSNCSYVAQQCGYRIAEIPVNWSRQPTSKFRILRDGLAMLRELAVIRRNRTQGYYAAPCQVAPSLAAPRARLAWRLNSFVTTLVSNAGLARQTPLRLLHSSRLSIGCRASVPATADGFPRRHGHSTTPDGLTSTTHDARVLPLVSAHHSRWAVGMRKVTSVFHRTPLPDLSPRLANSVKLTFDPSFTHLKMQSSMGVIALTNST
jgi:hypothetical protein